MTTGWNLAALAVAAFAAVAITPARADDLPPLKRPDPYICTNDPAGDPSHPTQKCASLEDWRKYVREICWRTQGNSAFETLVGSVSRGCIAATITLDKVELIHKSQLAAYDRAVAARERLKQLQSGSPVPPDAPPPPRKASSRDSVPIYSTDTRAEVDVSLGSLTARFVIDTGAQAMSLTNGLAKQLLSRGEARLGPSRNWCGYDGACSWHETIVIRRLSIGSHTITDVFAVVVGDGAPDLLPFPVLNRFGKFSIDTAAGELVFG
jgi:predicted aspartyl protease